MTEPQGFPILRSKKQPLPHGWEERISAKHPDKPYFFNVLTGEKRWTSPLDSSQKVMAEKTKGKKRKIVESDGEKELNESVIAAERSSTADRPKLKARGQKNAANSPEKSNIDTPVMRLMREKLAQKRALEAEKKQKTGKQTSKAPSTQTENLTLSQNNVSQFESSVPEGRRTRRRSSIASSESINSEKSAASNASVLGSKIQLATSIPEENMENEDSPPTENDKLPKIPKINLVKTSPNSLKASCSENNKDAVDPPQTYAQKNIAEKRMQRLRKSLILQREKKTGKDMKSVQSTSRLSETLPANERLKKLRQSLTPESPSNKKSKLSESFSPITKSKLLKLQIPNLYKEAPNRIYSLENRVQKGGLMETIKNNQAKLDEEENVNSLSILEKIVSTDIDEEMDWEPIEDEKIMSEVQSVRVQLCENPAETPSNFSCKTLQSTAAENSALYVVIDTNVFLSNLPFVEEVRDSHSDIYGRPFIVVPWTVLQELDYMKDDKKNTRSEALKLKARKAVNFLNNHFTNKHPRFLGQTPTEVHDNKSKFEIECPDDEILQTCLQIKDASKSPVLLSYDKNLCNKAMFYDIAILGKNDPIEKIYFLKAAENANNFMSNSLHENINNESEEISLSRQELLEAENIMDKGRDLLQSLLSKVVATEMEKVFEKEWQLRCIIRPPWSFQDVFKCTLKHWIAAVSEGFLRKTEQMIKDVDLYLKSTPVGGRKLQDVKFFLEKCYDIAQTLNGSRYPEFRTQILRKFDALRLQCMEALEKLSSARFQETIGSVKDDSEEEMRSSLAFTVMEKIYSHARDICGMASTGLGLPCSFAYNKDHPEISTDYALKLHKEIGVGVNKLMNVLRMVLLKMDEDLYPNHKAILTLHEALVNFLPGFDCDEVVKMAPLDVYCCVKLKKVELQKGYEQLYELSVNFCKMANLECK